MDSKTKQAKPVAPRLNLLGRYRPIGIAAVRAAARMVSQKPDRPPEGCVRPDPLTESGARRAAFGCGSARLVDLGALDHRRRLQLAAGILLQPWRQARGSRVGVGL